MADADPIARALHPATARQASLAAWTDDPAVAVLFGVLRDLDAAGAAVEALHHDRPDVGAGAVRGDIGEIARLFERCPDRFFGLGWRTRANGGACAGLWQLLGARRDAWIDAQLEAEGFPPFASSVGKDSRIIDLGGVAVSVELAWERFRTGVSDFTAGTDSPKVAAP